LLGRFIKSQERRFATRDTNRIVRPFDWGTSFIREHANGDDPRLIFGEHTRDVMRHSEDFYAPAPISDYQLKEDNLLTWTSGVRTPSPENDTVRARFFPAPTDATRKGKAQSRRAVVVLPQWNADAESHVALCRMLNRFGIAALRVTLPYHEARRPPGLERADHLVSPNIGRTIQSMRQEVADARAAVSWLAARGFGRIGIVGTSIGSCIAFLTFAHDARLKTGVFNHVSGYVADVVWHGISTQHVRAGIEPHITLDELRRYWLPISPLPFAQRLLDWRPARPIRFISARHDLTFPAYLSREVIAQIKNLGVPLDAAWLPCGHYTAGEKPWVYLDGWKIISYLRKHL
jgi:dienelactone hydrolase